MSYRDLRNFPEMMRALGYPRLISIENFRNPNFQLVSEILTWLVKRYEPNADLPTDTDTEQDRVIFVRSIAQFMATKAHIKLNTKKLYQADGYAVREMIKVTSLLYSAMKANVHEEAERVGEPGAVPLALDVSSKISELKQTRQLGSEITAKGAVLYDLLGQEVELREIRNNVISRQLELNEVEQGMRHAVHGVEDDIKRTNSLIENVTPDETDYEGKIEKKKSELERSRKRLQTLKKVRPAFMDEYEKLETELKKCYEDYMVRFRCLSYLEQELEEYERVEQERMAERQAATKKLLERLRQEETLRSLENAADQFENDKLNMSPDSEKDEKKLSASNQGMRGGGGAAPRRVFGNMTGGDDDTGSLESDSDIILNGEEDGSDIGTDEELQIDNLTSRKVNQKPENSDDEF